MVTDSSVAKPITRVVLVGMVVLVVLVVMVVMLATEDVE